MENKNERITDEQLMESLTLSVIMSIVDNCFNTFCDRQLGTEKTCDDCIYRMCKTEYECKAMFVKEALETYINRL